MMLKSDFYLVRDKLGDLQVPEYDYQVLMWIFTPFHYQVDSYYELCMEMIWITDICTPYLVPFATSVYDRVEIMCDGDIDYSITEIDPKFIAKVVYEIVYNHYKCTDILRDVVEMTKVQTSFEGVQHMHADFVSSRHRNMGVVELWRDTRPIGIGFKAESVEVPYDYDHYRDKYIMSGSSKYTEYQEFRRENYYG